VVTAHRIRESTVASHRAGVAHAIELMRADVSAPLRLLHLAKVAGMSECHFVRVFHESTGLPPLRFLSALRLARARDKLISTDDSVIEICLDVGYSSIGTFTRRFTQLVGISPLRLRQFARGHTLLQGPTNRRVGALVRVRLIRPAGELGDDLGGPALVAAFGSPLPFGRPAACALALAGGSLSLTGLAPGQYYLLAFASVGRLNLGTGPVSLSIDDRIAQCDIDLALRRFELTDPPLLSFVPFILHRGVETAAAARVHCHGWAGGSRARDVAG
jgi:AraC-like DNA-binding protein